MTGARQKPAPGSVLAWDTSPLHHAIKADKIDLLGDLASGRNGRPRRNVTTATVIQELHHYDLDTSGLDWLEVEHVDDLDTLVVLAEWLRRVSGQRRTRAKPPCSPGRRRMAPHP